MPGFALSYGGGVNSTALYLLIVEKKLPLDVVIFADTGNEMPETYDFIMNQFKPFVESGGHEFVIVKREEILRDHYFTRKLIPMRRFRSCSDKFKIRPIRKYLHARFKDYSLYIGIDYGELGRMRASDRKYQTNLYPLVEERLDRQACAKLIHDAGLPVPIKSGCYFCPYQTVGAFRTLKIQHPDLFKLAQEFEENGSGWPTATLCYNGPLKDIENWKVKPRKHTIICSCYDGVT